MTKIDNLFVGSDKPPIDPIFLDCETCGFHSFVVLIQYAVGDGPITLYDVWKEPVEKTLALIEYIYAHPIIGFNLTFDLYHLVKCYNCFRLVKDKSKPPDINEIYSLQAEARDGLCLKPLSILDLFLHARKGPYQNLMDRKDIRIKRIPKVLVYDLVDELEKKIKLNPIFFARRKIDGPIWQVEDTKVEDEILPGFSDIILRFAPSSGLKALAVDALKLNVTHFSDIEVKCPIKLIEYGYDPTHGNWNEVITYHINHWRYNKEARDYAEKDVVYTRDLFRHFGSPPCDDIDSTLAGMVPTVRWKGFKVNLDKIKALLEKSKLTERSAPRSPGEVKKYISQVLDANEKVAFTDTTKQTLASIAKWEITNEDGSRSPHPASIRALAVARARSAEKNSDLYEKIIQAGRFHPSFKVIGALSGRMSGADDLNAQGIPKLDEVREAFELALDGEFLDKGDFDAFEASIAAAAYNDEDLTKELLSGKKIGGLMGVMMFPDMDYDEVMETDGTEDNRYKLGKNGVFALIYFGNEITLETKYGIPQEIGKPGVDNFKAKYKGVEKAQADTIRRFASIVQPGGIGTNVIWKEPAEFEESLLGFKRYFTLENKICKALYGLAKAPPPSLKKHNNIKVKRRDRMQTAGGAVMSALYGAAMQIQAAVVRAAGNHKIQSTGAGITKYLQVELWKLQPCGIGDWVIRPFQVHDEILAATKGIDTKSVVTRVIEHFKPLIPLVGMKWKLECASWGD